MLWCTLLFAFAHGPASQDASRELWSRFLAASATQAGTPIAAFHLRAEVLTRGGVQRNETDVDYRYLAPDCVRFLLASGRETGRFGPRQRDYWLKDREEVVVLSGAEYEEDRRLVDRMHAIARNFVALSDPGRIRVERCELLAEPPRDLASELVRATKKLSWLRVASPDFALLPPPEGSAPSSTLYGVDLALLSSGLPRFAIIREEAPPGGAAAPPMLLHLDRYEERSGFRIPLQIFVHELEPPSSPPVFSASPAQEIYVVEIDLRAPLSVDDFRPR